MSDAHYDKVELLLPMFGAHSGVTFLDYSPVPKPVTRTGAVTSTSQSKFYGSSGFFAGGSNNLALPNLSSLLIGAQDYTLSVWLYPTATPGSNQFPGVFSRRNSFSSGYTHALFFNQSLSLLWEMRQSGNGTVLSLTLGTLPINEWTHVAVTGDQSNHRGYVNGALVFEAARAFPFHTGGGESIRIGQLQQSSASGQNYTGYMQDLSLVIGHSRYNADFTPPPRLVGTVSGTITDAAGQPAVRKIFAVPRLAPLRTFGPVESASDGTYSLEAPVTECSRIVLAENASDPLYNDLIDRVIPA